MKREIISKKGPVIKAAYLAKEKILEVEAKSSTVHYHGVPEDAWDNLRESEICNEHYEKNIKGKYAFLKGEFILQDFSPLLHLEPIKDRIIVKIINIVPSNISSLLTPDGRMAPSGKDVEYDEHPVQGVIVALGPEAKTAGLDIGCKVALEHQPAFLANKEDTRDMFIWNNQVYAVQRLFNVICIIKEKQS